MLRSAFIGILIITAIIGIQASQAAGVESASALSSVDVGIREVSLGSLVADSVSDGGGAIAIVPAGSFRETTIPKGTVRTEDVLGALQYPEDRIAVIELTGAQLNAALERSIGIHPQRNLGFLQVAGITVEFDPKLPKDSRLLKATVNGDQIANDRKYRIATTEPLAKGAYGYFTIWGKDLPVTKHEKTLGQAISDFLAKQESLDYRESTRIKVKE